MAAYKLLLHPKDPACCVPVDALAGSLQFLGLIGAPADPGGTRYYPTGPHFLELVTFLGCSPAIELDPPQDQASALEASRQGRFVHVFLASSPDPVFRGDAGTPAPRCPHCRETLADWASLRDNWCSHPAQAAWTCAGCGQSGHPADLVFRKCAGVASSWVEIRGVYPSEALPGPTLLDCLRELAGCDWAAIYLQE